MIIKFFVCRVDDSWRKIVYIFEKLYALHYLCQANIQ